MKPTYLEIKKRYNDLLDLELKYQELEEDFPDFEKGKKLMIEWVLNG